MEDNLRLIRGTAAARKPNPFNLEKGIRSHLVQARISRAKRAVGSGYSSSLSAPAPRPSFSSSTGRGWNPSYRSSSGPSRGQGFAGRTSSFRSSSSRPSEYGDARSAQSPTVRTVPALISSYGAPASSCPPPNYQSRVETLSVRKPTESVSSRPLQPFYPNEPPRGVNGGLSNQQFLEAEARPEARRAVAENHLRVPSPRAHLQRYVPPELVDEEEYGQGDGFEYDSDGSSGYAIPVEKVSVVDEPGNEHCASAGQEASAGVTQQGPPSLNTSATNGDVGKAPVLDRMTMPPLYKRRRWTNIFRFDKRRASSDMTDLKVLTLNFWGIRFLSKHVPERLKALIEVLSSTAAEWDFVALEEVWSDHDYQFLKESLANTYPHSYYFYSGVIGSGVCIFSKGQIMSVLTHQFSLNGHAHKIQHGDWFGGKVVGLCKIFHKGLRINLYATHVHAEYNRKSDEYLSHRIVQAYEFSQFIRCTNHIDDDINIVAGDFNFEPTDLGYDVVCRFADLRDSWIDAQQRDELDNGDTCNSPDNIYSVLEDKADLVPRGKRIDFIMFGECSGRTNVLCQSARTVLNKIPGSALCYSDHKGLEAVFRVGRANLPDAVSTSWSAEQMSKTLEDALAVLNNSLLQVARNSKFYFVVFTAFLVLLVSTIDSDSHSGCIHRWSMMALRFVSVVSMAWSLVLAVILSRTERHALLATRNAMLIQRDWDTRKRGEGTDGPH